MWQGKSRSYLRNIFRYFGISIVIAFTLIPILRTVYFLWNFGENNPSSDDIAFVSLFDKVLTNRYYWPNFFENTFFHSPAQPFTSGHSDTIPVLTQILISYFSDRLVFIIPIYVGIFLAIIKLILFYATFTFYLKNKWRWLLWPILSFFIFSPTQISTYEFGLASLEQNFFQTGFIFGQWALIRYSGKWIGLVLMAIGGVIASWSWGGGVIVWPIFLLELWLLQFRKLKFYLLWLLAAFWGLFPYFYFLVLQRSGDTPVIVFLLKKNLEFSYFIEAIGWPFVNNNSLNIAFSRGLIFLILFSTGLILYLIRTKPTKLSPLIPVVGIFCYGILLIFQIGLFRGTLTIWYRSPFYLIWFSLIGLAYLNLSYSNKKKIESKFLKINLFHLQVLWFFSIMGFIGFFFYEADLSFFNKTHYIKTRSPTASSCLRNYKSAPTYCEPFLFIWGGGWYESIYDFGDSQRTNKMSVFAPHQRWTLQGDFVLNNVKIHERPHIPDIFWSKDLTSTPVPFHDFRPLNIFLHTPNLISWSVSLPQNLKEATFHSAVAISKSAPFEETSDGVIFEVGVEETGKGPENYFTQFLGPNHREWYPFSFSLNQFKGKIITLHLTSKMVGNINHDWAMYRSPYIDIKLDNSNFNEAGQLEISRPTNTDLYPFLSKPKQGDFIFDLTNLSVWVRVGLEPGESQLSLVDLVDGHLDDLKSQCESPPEICFRDYSYFWEIYKNHLKALFLIQYGTNFISENLDFETPENFLQCEQSINFCHSNYSQFFDLMNLVLEESWEFFRQLRKNILTGTWKVTGLSYLQYRPSLNLCLDDFSHLYFKLAASRNINPRMAEVYLRIGGQPGMNRVVQIPLLSDEEVHEYTYDLKLLELNSKSKLTGFKIVPVSHQSGKGWVQISDIALIRRNGSNVCQ